MPRKDGRRTGGIMSSYKLVNTPGNTDWFVHDRFGMFIHFGLYAMPARHEWIKRKEHIPEEQYDKYFKYFNPDMYDPKDWAKRAKAAGMKYVVLTTKHHEGFCLFDTAYTDYKITNTPFGRDLVREYVDAFRAEGLKIGFYYSLLDWHHPDFTVDGNHPYEADAETLNVGRDMKRYAKYMRDQVTELLTNYGEISILWFDFSYPGKGKDEWEAEELIATARRLQPGIMIDNRTQIKQDIVTPEQYQIKEWPRNDETGEYEIWEACQTFSGSWGYHRDEMSWKSPEQLVNMLIRTVSIGGNLIMNVGPTSRGYFDYRACNALDTYAEWMKYNNRSIYGCTMAEPEFLEHLPNGCLVTQSEDSKRLYIHLIEYPFQTLEYRGLAGKIDYAQFLHDGSEVHFDERRPKHFSEGMKAYDDQVIFWLPTIKPHTLVPVIEVFLK